MTARLAVWPDHHDGWAVRIHPDDPLLVTFVRPDGTKASNSTGGPNICRLNGRHIAPIGGACRDAFNALGIPHVDGTVGVLGRAMLQGALNLGVDLPVWPSQRGGRYAISVLPNDIQGKDWAVIREADSGNLAGGPYLCEYAPPESRTEWPQPENFANTEALDYLGLPHDSGTLTPEGVAMVLGALDTRPTLPVWPTTVNGYALRRGHGEPPVDLDNIFLVAADGDRILSGSLCPLEDNPEHSGYSGVDTKVCKILGLETTGTHATAKACARARRAIRLANAWTPPAPPKPEYEPLFTPFHYEALAAAFRGVFTAEYARRKAGEMPLNDTETTARVIRETADILAIDNPHFDRIKFYADCGCLPDGSPDYTIES